MPEPSTLETLSQILRDLLFDDTIVLTESTVRADIPEWDSFAYVNFIVAAEMHFGVKFGVAEVESFVTVGQIATRIEELVANA